jgi:4-hydroxymandelate oxidase
MKRRNFNQLLALGAGSLGFVSANARQAAAAQPSGGPNKEEGPRGANAADLPPREAVTVNGFRQLAQARLDKSIYEYIATGSADEVTLRENLAAFQRLKILPPLLTGVGKADLSTVVLKQRVTLPVLLAPVAGQRLFHPQGGIAAARAAAAAGTIYGVSSSVGHSAEEIAAASKGPKWFQLYMPNNREVARRLLERVDRAGYQAIILTVDLGEWKDADRRNRFALPKEMLVKLLRDVGFDEVTDRMSYQEVLAFHQRTWDTPMTWEVFDWLRSLTKLPLLIKGVLRKEDAKKAVSIGLDGIIVSNHGGRRLDGMPASIAMLPQVVEAVAGRAEVFLDGGIRRGTDVLKALALGAKAVLIGRPYAWALAADGEAGVRKVLDLLGEELANAMVATGCAKVGDIHRSLIAD